MNTVVKPNDHITVEREPLYQATLQMITAFPKEIEAKRWGDVALRAEQIAHLARALEIDK